MALTPPIPRELINVGFGTEIIYSFVIILCSLIIYFGTKELYELSSYKGIKYFRQAFLFFAIAYFFRSFIKFILVYFNTNELFEVSPRILFGLFGQITLFIFIYFSSMAIFYLLYSVMWKRLNKNKNNIYLFHILAFIISTISILSRNMLVYIGLNVFLLFFVIFIVSLAYNNSEYKKKGHNMYIIYVLLLLFWILNIFDVLIPKFFENIKLIIYLASCGIFLMIFYRVVKKTGSN
ncbi:hypothetical protein J4438_03055 [Candidatus Woesearchaeota archaeon]|nr:hypothetical protein [Candidatus Woesearchaeota archaeon]